MARANVSIGVAGTLGAETIGRLASAVETAGFGSLWINDGPGSDPVAALVAATAATERLTVATGVIPMDRRNAADLAAAVLSADLPQHRLRLGIGSGQARSGVLALVGEAVDVLHAELDAAILVGALGPKMRGLGAERADGVLLSWLPPAIAAEQAETAHAASADAHVALYVRTALRADAGSRLAGEAAQYSRYPAYAANFARLGITADQTVIVPEAAADRLARYRESVDEVVLRAIVAGDCLDDYLRFVDDAAALL
jgi:alkanesulfonate monooxygenase SsuD/methylene tetrahydromethanopterin reductase-like flavin-dependent oxidoreductase (luciferase family)